jgi:nitrilase
MYRAMGEIDCHILPAAFTYTTGQVHWEILLRARAIENQSYLVASAQGGLHENGRQTWGHSMVIDPWGKILCELDKGEGLVTSEIDKSYLLDIRSKLPALAHRTIQ